MTTDPPIATENKKMHEQQGAEWVEPTMDTLRTDNTDLQTLALTEPPVQLELLNDIGTHTQRILLHATAIASRAPVFIMVTDIW